MSNSWVYISTCTGSSLFLRWSWLDIQVWIHISWPWLIRIAQKIPRKTSWVPEHELQYLPFGSTLFDTHSIFPQPCDTNGSYSSCDQSTHTYPLPLWIIPAVSLWKRCFDSQVSRPRVCFIDFLLVLSLKLSSSFILKKSLHLYGPS